MKVFVTPTMYLNNLGRALHDLFVM